MAVSWLHTPLQEQYVTQNVCRETVYYLCYYSKARMDGEDTQQILNGTWPSSTALRSGETSYRATEMDLGVRKSRDWVEQLERTFD